MIRNNIKSILNKDVVSTVLLTITRMVTGPVTMLLIPVFLSGEMQGFWFTFASISALSIFADLGFTVIVTQFAAHEFAHLNINRDNEFEGTTINFNRLASFFRFILRWSITMVIITFPLIFLIGCYILGGEIVDFQWIFPWLIYVLAAGVLFLANIIFSFFEGCKMMAKAQRIRLYSLLINFATVILCLTAGLNLYSLAIAMALNALCCITLLLLTFLKQIKQMLFTKIIVHPWKNDVLKLLWKYAISWSSGYFIFQMFTPIAFHYFGSVIAGKIGITISLISAVSSVANVWLYAANPEINSLVSKNKILELNELFKKQVLLSALTYVLVSTGCLIIFYFIPEQWGFKQRFLDFTNLIFLLVAWFFQLLISAMATYMRAHKEEPLMLPSVISGIYIAITTFIAANLFPKEYLLFGFYSSFIIVLPWVYILYKNKKNKLSIVGQNNH